MDMTDSPVIFEKDGRLARITLNRPEVLNAIDDRIPRLLQDALEKANADESDVPDQYWSNGRIKDCITEAGNRSGNVHAFPCSVQALQTEVALRCDADREGIQERNQSETGDD